MPLIVLSDGEAVANRKKNPYATWGDRADENRIEPVAKPHFDVPFKIKPGDRIFTIGSCFARNVERELLRRGFIIPVRELFKRPDFRNLSFEVINNYGTPSIYNEIAWAFGDRPFEPAQHLLEVRDGKFADIHLSPTLRPEPFDTVLGRRAAISEAYRLAASCNTMIMTLGLAELWFDALTGYYLNVAPRPALMARHPGRFEFHVLNFEEAYDYLERAILILRRNAPQMQFLLTVSPVPLTSTHRAVDVMAANMYSKAVLRVAAEAIVARHSFTAYYPSFESVTLSDRKIAWMQDMIHVSPEMVALNVGRMIHAFAGGEGESETIDDELSACERAKLARGGAPEFADVFFRTHAAWSQTSVQFALEHARHLLMVGKAAEALAIVSKHRPSEPNIAAVTAEALVETGDPQKAIDLLNPFCQPDAKSFSLWEGFLSAALAVADPDKVNAALARHSFAIPGRSAPAYLRVAKWFLTRGEKKRATVLANAVLEQSPPNLIAFDLAEFMIELGDLAQASNALRLVNCTSAIEKARAARIQSFLGA